MKDEWPKSPEAAVARFWGLVPDDPRVQRKQMFGYPCAVVGGNMFMSLHGENLVLRLPEGQVEELVNQAGFARFEPMAGRPMKGYVAIAANELLDSPRLGDLVQAAFAHGSALPVKERAPRKRTRER